MRVNSHMASNIESLPSSECIDILSLLFGNQSFFQTTQCSFNEARK